MDDRRSMTSRSGKKKSLSNRKENSSQKKVQSYKPRENSLSKQIKPVVQRSSIVDTRIPSLNTWRWVSKTRRTSQNSHVSSKIATPDKQLYQSSSLKQHTFSSARRAEQTSQKKKSSEKAYAPISGSNSKRNIPKPISTARAQKKPITYLEKPKIRPSRLDFSKGNWNSL